MAAIAGAPTANDDLLALAPACAIEAIRVLEDAGHEAWVVGGWVRDALRGTGGHDVDVTTDAPWQETARAFRDAGYVVYETGTKHGTVTAIVMGEPVEVTTYRVEAAYSDHRHPDEVRFVTDVREDLARRDFTINAMAWHPRRGLLDPFGGQRDLARGLIRAVGDPYRRFEEDALRVLRAVRFACRLRFSVEDETQVALDSYAPTLAAVAQERIGKELDGIVRSGLTGWALLNQTEAMCAAIPELYDLRGFDQNSPYHLYDVLEHTAHVCMGVQEFTGGAASPALAWAALLHDVAKPATYSEDETGRGHFFGHPRAGARMAEMIMRRLAIPREVARPACILVRYHDHVVHPTLRSMRRTLQKFSHDCPGQEAALAFDLMNLKRSDAIAKAPHCYYYAHELDEMSAILARELAEGPVFKVSQLKVTGSDVLEVSPEYRGWGVGLMLDTILTFVVDGVLPNERDAQLAWLRANAGL